MCIAKFDRQRHIALTRGPLMSTNSHSPKLAGKTTSKNETIKRYWLIYHSLERQLAQLTTFSLIRGEVMLE